MTTPIVWFEVLGDDPDNLKSFYGDLFGWSFEPMGPPKQAYGGVGAAEGGIPGGVGRGMPGQGWTTFYAGVDDVEGALQKAVSLGGSVLMPTTELPEITLAVFADPEGHPVGLVKNQ